VGSLCSLHRFVASPPKSSRLRHLAPFPAELALFVQLALAGATERCQCPSLWSDRLNYALPLPAPSLSQETIFSPGTFRDIWGQVPKQVSIHLPKAPPTSTGACAFERMAQHLFVETRRGRVKNPENSLNNRFSPRGAPAARLRSCMRPGCGILLVISTIAGIIPEPGEGGPGSHHSACLLGLGRNLNRITVGGRILVA
jgi:hypothetical protein